MEGKRERGKVEKPVSSSRPQEKLRTHKPIASAGPLSVSREPTSIWT